MTGRTAIHGTARRRLRALDFRKIRIRGRVRRLMVMHRRAVRMLRFRSMTGHGRLRMRTRSRQQGRSGRADQNRNRRNGEKATHDAPHYTPKLNSKSTAELETRFVWHRQQVANKNVTPQTH